MIERALGVAKAARTIAASVHPPAIVFDADPWDERRREALAQLRKDHPHARIVACVGFPRPDLDAELRTSGADAIWYKLATLADLARQLAEGAETER
jgi:hypothetical protein